MAPEDDVRLTVVVPTRNGRRHVEEQLAALAAQAWDQRWEIVLVNNDSDDGTRDILERWLPNLPVSARLVDADQHHSLSYARNAGAKAARGRSIAFCDDDDIVHNGWVSAIGAALEESSFVGSSFDYTLLNPPAVAAARGSFQTVALGEFMGVTVVSGGGSGCRRALWEDLGGNDLNFTGNGQDIDFSLRVVRDRGIEPVICREAIYHVRLRGGVWPSYSQGERFAMASVTLFRVHRDTFDASPEPAARTVRRWLGLLWRLPDLLHPESRLKWFWQLGYRVGRLRGSAKERAWYP